MARKKKLFSSWTWREYVLQLSVVIIGIVVTFAGSDWISSRSRASEVRATMGLVHAELETDRARLRETLDWMRWEAHAFQVLTHNRGDLEQIPGDTMSSFAYVGGRILSFHPRRDAFEVLKNTGLMAAVRDKQLLLTVTQGYAALSEMEENIALYYAQKINAQNEMTRSLDDAAREAYYFGGAYAMWGLMLAQPVFADFMLSAPSYFEEGYLAGLVMDVDRALEALEKKYNLKTGDK